MPLNLGGYGSLPEQICQLCGSRDSPELLVYCSICFTSAEHRYCLKELPEEANGKVVWLCEDCLSGTPNATAVERQSLELNEENDKVNYEGDQLKCCPQVEKMDALHHFVEEDNVNTFTDKEDKNLQEHSVIRNDATNVNTLGEHPHTFDPGSKIYHATDKESEHHRKHLNENSNDKTNVVAQLSAAPVITVKLTTADFQNEGKNNCSQIPVNEEKICKRHRRSWVLYDEESDVEKDVSVDVAHTSHKLVVTDQMTGSLLGCAFVVPRRRLIIDDDEYDKEENSVLDISQDSDGVGVTGRVNEPLPYVSLGKDDAICHNALTGDGTGRLLHNGAANLSTSLRVADPHNAQVRSPSPYLVDNADFAPALPVRNCIWRGYFNICSGNFATVAHLSSRACEQVKAKASILPHTLSFQIEGRESWPNSFKRLPPNDNSIALYFFPDSDRSCPIYYNILKDIVNQDIMMKVILEDAELLIFSSVVLPSLHQRFQGKHYFWGVFKSRKIPHSSIPMTSPLMGDVDGYKMILQFLEKRGALVNFCNKFCKELYEKFYALDEALNLQSDSSNSKPEDMEFFTQQNITSIFHNLQLVKNFIAHATSMEHCEGGRWAVGELDKLLKSDILDKFQSVCSKTELEGLWEFIAKLKKVELEAIPSQLPRNLYNRMESLMFFLHTISRFFPVEGCNTTSNSVKMFAKNEQKVEELLLSSLLSLSSLTESLLKFFVNQMETESQISGTEPHDVVPSQQSFTKVDISGLGNEQKFEKAETESRSSKTESQHISPSQQPVKAQDAIGQENALAAVSPSSPLSLLSFHNNNPCQPIVQEGANNDRLLASASLPPSPHLKRGNSSPTKPYFNKLGKNYCQTLQTCFLGRSEENNGATKVSTSQISPSIDRSSCHELISQDGGKNDSQNLQADSINLLHPPLESLKERRDFSLLTSCHVDSSSQDSIVKLGREGQQIQPGCRSSPNREIFSKCLENSQKEEIKHVLPTSADVRCSPDPVVKHVNPTNPQSSNALTKSVTQKPLLQVKNRKAGTISVVPSSSVRKKIQYPSKKREKLLTQKLEVKGEASFQGAPLEPNSIQVETIWSKHFPPEVQCSNLKSVDHLNVKSSLQKKRDVVRMKKPTKEKYPQHRAPELSRENKHECGSQTGINKLSKPIPQGNVPKYPSSLEQSKWRQVSHKSSFASTDSSKMHNKRWTMTFKSNPTNIDSGRRHVELHGRTNNFTLQAAFTREPIKTQVAKNKSSYPLSRGEYVQRGGHVCSLHGLSRFKNNGADKRPAAEVGDRNQPPRKTRKV